MSMEETKLIEELKKLGWRYVRVFGHGDTEPIGEGEMVVGDVEKEMVLVPPSCIWNKPETIGEYFGL